MRRLILATLLSLTVALPAHAQAIADKAREAEGLLARGRIIEAIEALDEAANALWEKAPLSFRRSVWVQQPGSGFGAFRQRANNVFPAGEPLYLYAEPIGFGWKRQQDDTWQTDLIADLTIRDANGKQLAEQKDFQRLNITSRVRNREFMVNFTYTLSGIPKGNYLLETTLRDQVTGKSGSTTLPFVIQ
jgi:hypothetical protein